MGDELRTDLVGDLFIGFRKGRETVKRLGRAGVCEGEWGRTECNADGDESMMERGGRERSRVGGAKAAGDKCACTKYKTQREVIRSY